MIREEPNCSENRRFRSDRDAKGAIEVFRGFPSFGQVGFVEDDGASEEGFDVGAGSAQGARRVEEAIGRESPKSADFEARRFVVEEVERGGVETSEGFRAGFEDVAESRGETDRKSTRSEL